MSASITGIQVVFKTDVSEEYAEKLKNAIQMFSHIADVRLIENDFDIDMGALQEQSRIKTRFIEFIKEIGK